jgi:hypothetical protein
MKQIGEIKQRDSNLMPIVFLSTISFFMQLCVTQYHSSEDLTQRGSRNIESPDFDGLDSS